MSIDHVPVFQKEALLISVKGFTPYYHSATYTAGGAITETFVYIKNSILSETQLDKCVIVRYNYVQITENNVIIHVRLSFNYIAIDLRSPVYSVLTDKR